MKSALNQISLKNIVLVVLCMATATLFGQTTPQIDVQFANPSYDRETRTYKVDVEFKSMTEPEMLFAMNVRFFYDATMLQYKGIEDFHSGYGFLGEAPVAITGTADSGVKLFNFEEAAGYINGTVILLSTPNPLHILTDSWSKGFSVAFEVPVTTLDKENFCPSILWDKESDPADGGFLPGSEGVLITVVERDRSSRNEATNTNTYGYPFNWEHDTEAGLPFGSKASIECISVEETTATEDPDKSHVDGYELFQNTPNPFDGRTLIEFILPSAQNATLVLYDVDGVIKETIDGHYEKGRNQIELKKKPWMVESSLIYYRLQTDKYTSRTIAMTLVRA